jgi:hypothetical protein
MQVVPRDLSVLQVDLEDLRRIDKVQHIEATTQSVALVAFACGLIANL